MRRWKDVADYISPYSGRFNIRNSHNDDRNYDLILDNEASRALNILVSGLASGATSPVRQWFKVGVSNIDAQLDTDVAQWCANVEHMLLKVFQASNTYNSLHVLYKELVLFGVGVDLIYDDFNNIIRHHVLTAGEYCIATNSDGVVDTLYREFQLTAIQAAKFFGYDNLPKNVKDLCDRGALDEYLTFVHAIEPREDRDLKSKSNKDMPYASYYFCTDTDDKLISRESGYNMFPALCPRWDVLGIDPYGLSPSITALPSVKQLQQETEAKSIILENLADPAVQAPSSARQNPISLIAGSVNFTSSTGVDSQIRPIIQTAGDINAITADIMELKQGIKADYFVDLFLLIQSAQTDRKTATEIAALKEEKMLVLGAVMERLQHELLSPLVMMTYNKLEQGGVLPPPPNGNGVEVEFQSMLAQSQRAVDINAIDRMVSSMQAISSSMPEVLDRINPDGIFDVYRDRLAVDPKIARSEQEANEIRQARAQAQQQAMEQEQLASMGQTAASFAQAQKLGADASMATQQLEQVGAGGGY